MKHSSNSTINGAILIFILLSVLISVAVMAETNTDPSIKISRAFNNIEQEVNQLKSNNKSTRNELTTVLNKYLLPEINSRYFAMKSLGKYVKTMSDENKLAYTNELQIQLINNYANLLSKHNNDKISTGSSNISASGKSAQVNLKIENKNHTNRAIIKLIKTSKQDWQIFDIVVEGISLLQTKQAELNSSITKIGVDSTLEKLKSINAKNKLI